MPTLHSLYPVLARHFRTGRMRLFCERFAITAETRVLDVGGTADNWLLAPVRPQVTILNTAPTSPALPEGMSYVAGDACRLDYPDGAFDVVYSNSVIEHLGTWENQQRMATEVRRVGRGYFVQTPDRAFPVEPHYLTPFVHYLPVSLRRHVLRRGTVWGWMEKPSPARVERRLASIRLLSAREFHSLFPDASFHVERFAGLSKSLLAFRTTRSEAQPARAIGAAAQGDPRPRAGTLS